jgi:membrane protein required for colicin V production
MIAGLSWVDWALAAVLAVSVVVGLWRGLVYEVLSLIGWVVAFVVAQAYGAVVAAWLPFGGPAGSLGRLAAGFALTFLGALVVWTLLAKLVRLLISATPLSVLDRALGSLFGLVRGVVVLLAVALVVKLTPAARSPAWQASHGAAWLDVALQTLDPLWPAGAPARRAA